MRHKRTPRLHEPTPLVFLPFGSAQSSLAPPVTQNTFLDLQHRLASLEAEKEVLEKNHQAFTVAVENLERARLDLDEEQKIARADSELRIDFGCRQIEIFEKREAALHTLCDRMLRVACHDTILASAYNAVTTYDLEAEVALATRIQLAIRNSLDMWHKILPPVTGPRQTSDYQAIDRFKRQAISDAEREHRMMKVWRDIARESGDQSVTPSASNVSSLGCMSLSNSRQFAVDSLLSRYREGSMPPRWSLNSTEMPTAMGSLCETDAASASPDTMPPASTVLATGDLRGVNKEPVLGVRSSDPQVYRPESIMVSKEETRAMRPGLDHADNASQATYSQQVIAGASDGSIAIGTVQDVLSDGPSLVSKEASADDRILMSIPFATTHGQHAALLTTSASLHKSSSSRRSSVSVASARGRRTSVTFATDATSKPAPQMPPKRRPSRTQVNISPSAQNLDDSQLPLPNVRSATRIPRPASILRLPKISDASGFLDRNTPSG